MLCLIPPLLTPLTHQTAILAGNISPPYQQQLGFGIEVNSRPSHVKLVQSSHVKQLQKPGSREGLV